MIFSIEILKRFVDLEGITPAELIQRLTFAGFEVEDHHPISQASAVISGRILECVPHPDSDHLHVLKVDLGPEEGIRQIVCGAPNAKEGMNVIVALPGCELKALGKVIEAGKVRGIESDGMCCALDELGIPAAVLPESEVKGIHDLGPDYPVGDREVLTHIGYGGEALDINVLPNRPDCLSYLGIAREIAALCGRKFLPVNRDDLSALPASVSAINKTEAAAKFSILTAELGPVDRGFAASLARDLQVSGVRSVSPLVDLGNFVMLVTGQPFQIYDLDRVQGHSFTVTDTYRGDFVTFDGRKLQLQPGDLVVLDEQGTPLCLAGIAAGESTACTANTARIAVEAASFYHASIRRTSARLGLSSASSLLFGKGVNPREVLAAQSIFAHFLRRLFPAAKLLSFAEDGKAVPQNKPFPFSIERLNHRLGTSYSAEEVNRVLQAYEITDCGHGQVVGPAYRTDLNQQADVDEEVFRFYPASRVPLSYAGMPQTVGGLTESQRQVAQIRQTLEGFSLSEIISFTLESESMSQSVRVFDRSPAYRVLNPLTKDHEMVRIDLVPSMVSILERNAARRHNDLSFYEISATDSPLGRRQLLCIGLLGQRHDQDLKGSRPWDFFDLKGMFEALLTTLGISENRVRLVRSVNPAFHPGMSADVLLGKQVVATFGELNPGSFARPYLILEADLSALLGIRTGRVHQVPFGSHPSVRRDLSFDLLGEVSFADLVKRARTGSKLLTKIELFDSYTDKAGHRSIGVALTFSADDYTLKDEEIDQALNAVALAISTKLPLKLRSGKEGD